MEGSLNHELKQGFSGNAILRIKQQAKSGTRILYEIGNRDGRPPNLCLAYADNDALTASVKIDNNNSLEVSLQKFTRTKVFDRFAYFRLELQYIDNQVKLDLYANNESFTSNKTIAQSLPKHVSYHTIGADLNGAKSATFEAKEIIIVDHDLNDEQRQKFAKYFWLQWHD